LLGAGVKNLSIFYHGRGGEVTSGGLERLPSRARASFLL